MIAQIKSGRNKLVGDKMLKKARTWLIWLLLLCIYCSVSLLTKIASKGPFDPGGGDVKEDYLGVDIVVEPNECSEEDRGVILVHSFAANFQLRASQREAKGRWLEGKRFKHVFVLFHSSEVDVEEVVEEWAEHQDILLGDSEEGYRMLAYKHLAGLRWVNQRCDRVETVIKMDDDIFVDFAQILTKGKAYKKIKLDRGRKHI